VSLLTARESPGQAGRSEEGVRWNAAAWFGRPTQTRERGLTNCPRPAAPARACAAFPDARHGVRHTAAGTRGTPPVSPKFGWSQVTCAVSSASSCLRLRSWTGPTAPTPLVRTRLELPASRRSLAARAWRDAAVRASPPLPPRPLGRGTPASAGRGRCSACWQNQVPSTHKLLELAPALPSSAAGLPISWANGSAARCLRATGAGQRAPAAGACVSVKGKMLPGSTAAAQLQPGGSGVGLSVDLAKPMEIKQGINIIGNNLCHLMYSSDFEIIGCFLGISR